MNADHKLPLKASAIDGFARAIAGKTRCRAARRARAPEGADAYVNAIAEDLPAHKGTSLVLAGEAQPPQVHALAHAINQALGNVGQTVSYLPPPEIVPSDQHAALRELVSDMNAGRVQMLVMIGESNPVQTAPADLNFADAISKVQTRLHSGLFFDETATLSTGTCRRRTTSKRGAMRAPWTAPCPIVQPLIQPLYAGRSAHEIVQTLLDRPERNPLRRRPRVLDGAAGRPRRKRSRHGCAAAAARATSRRTGDRRERRARRGRRAAAATAHARTARGSGIREGVAPLAARWLHSGHRPQCRDDRRRACRTGGAAGRRRPASR